MEALSLIFPLIDMEILLDYFSGWYIFFLTLEQCVYLGHASSIIIKFSIELLIHAVQRAVASANIYMQATVHFQ